ncbi:MAG: TonB-dependent receptor [Ignavibacteriae bacterium]|nr:TonB-dependent receptor [Ignavibacteriota bacterium]
MKKIIVIICMLNVVLFAQEQTKTQSIELPDFVITGVQNISLPKIQKKQPEFIPLLSKDFFNPTFPGVEEIPLEMPKLKVEHVDLNNLLQENNALIKVNAGLHTWPSGEFYYNNWKNNFSYNAHLFGLRELNYIDDAGVNFAGGKLGVKYFVDREAGFLPGLEISVDGGYKIESFNFFGSQTPSVNREAEFGNGTLSFNYGNKSSVNFGLNIQDDYYNQRDDSTIENVINTNAYIKYKINKLTFELNGTIKNQSLSTSLPTLESGNFYNTTASIGVNVFRNLNIKGGFNFSKSGTNTFVTPFAFASLRMSDNLTFWGEFSPYAELITLKDFVRKNRYYNLNSFANSFVENDINLKVAMRFNHKENIEITGGGGFINSDNAAYFLDNNRQGFFDIYKDDIQNTFVFANILMRQGYLGDFYAELKVQDVKGSANNKVPYSPTIIGRLSYMYNWYNNFGTKLDLEFDDGAYFDMANTEKLPSKINASLSIYYEIFNNFNLTLQFENIFNTKYYYYNNYEAKPFDALLGFEYRW